MQTFENSIHQIFLFIIDHQKKLQSLRQLLNEQIQFNIKDLYLRISGNSTQVTAFHLHIFINQINQPQNNIDIKLLQSVIKGYNNCTSMKQVIYYQSLTFIQFGLIFLSKQNKLLAKLALQRNSLGAIPQHLLNHARKILQLQTSLHNIFQQFRKSHSLSSQQWIHQNTTINQQTKDQQFNEDKIKQICKQFQIQYDLILRYLKINQKQIIKSKKMLALFTLKNCQKLSEFLHRIQKNKNHINYKDIPDPFIRPEFHDCLDRPKILENFSYRQIKSIQKHLQRLNYKNKTQLEQKINYYRTFVQKQLKQTCIAINQIINLQHEIQQQRIQLCLCTDFYPILFYQSFNKDRQTYLIPSSFQNYLQRLGIQLQLNHLYTIFKRYSSRSDGKLTFNQFCSIFDVCHIQYLNIQKNRQIYKLQDIDIKTIKHFLSLIKILCINQFQIQKIKSKLFKNINIRQIFSIIDNDQDGYISMLDFKIIWKKLMKYQLKDQNIFLFWHRMKLNKDPNTMIKYQKFITQMTPKSSFLSKKIKNKQVTRK